MNTKHLTTLAVLAAVSVAATAWVLRTSAPSMASDRRGEAVVPSLVAKANDITGLSIRDSIGTLAIERRDNRFVAADSGYPIKTDAVGKSWPSTTYQVGREKIIEYATVLGIDASTLWRKCKRYEGT